MTFRLHRIASKSYFALITVQYMCINTYSQRESSATLKFLLFVCCSYKIADVLDICCLSPHHYAKISDYICQSSLRDILYQLFIDFQKFWKSRICRQRQSDIKQVLYRKVTNSRSHEIPSPRGQEA